MIIMSIFSFSDGLDYSGVNTTYTMSIDQPFICEVITLLPDNLVEMQESFLVGISSAFVSITNGTAVVNIAREFGKSYIMAYVNKNTMELL